MMVYWNWNIITSTFFHIKFFTLDYFLFQYFSLLCRITLVNNFLLFDCCLDFYNWFWVFLHCWIRKWHPFLSIMSGYFARLIWKKIQIFWQNRLHFCGIISWFLSTHIILNNFLREKKCFANNIYWLPDRNIDYCKLNGTIYQPLRSGRIWHKVNF